MEKQYITLLELKVIPSSGKQDITCDATGLLVCYLKSAPEKGRANKELLDMLGKRLGMPSTHLVVVRGLATRRKVIKLPSPLLYKQVIEKLLSHK